MENEHHESRNKGFPIPCNVSEFANFTLGRNINAADFLFFTNNEWIFRKKLRKGLEKVLTCETPFKNSMVCKLNHN